MTQRTGQIQVGDKVPAVTLQEFVEVEGEGCPLGPNPVDLAALTTGKRVVLFALPGAYTPTCSGNHVPGYIDRAEAFKSLGIDGIYCVSVNDAFVMGAWGRELGVNGKVRMLADGSADFTRAAGLSQDLSARGLGLRSQRCSMLIVDGVVRILNIEEPGKFGVSDADTLLSQVRNMQDRSPK